MEQTNGFYKKFDKNGNEIKEMLFTYDEGEREQNEINKANAKLVFSPEFIPFYIEPFRQYRLSIIENLLYGFIRFYLGTGIGKRFFFTNEHLMIILNISEKTLKNSLKKLKDLNLIKATHQVKSGGGLIRFIELPRTKGQSLPLLKGKFYPYNNNKIKENN